ncbi:oxidoreductase [Priestia megaterium]|uniref:SDR family oxidoreductase n=1 Tax=Priestia megaterium TaxID=1404 RepID=UPI000BECF801|nr:SDR family oxidoreductase [Priestia megaterium]PEB61950.1 oxidoreductase [Priestia megaterium]
MLNVEEKVVILTGASSGIGEATAKVLANTGAKVVLSARREDRLRKLKSEIENRGGTVEYKVTDVTSQQQLEDLASFTLENFGQIDVLINNAGFMPLSYLHEKRVTEWEQMIDVNVKGVLYGIAAVLPYMRRKKQGHIINVSSVAGHIAFPSSAVYSGTKFAVRAITEGLRQEEVENNVRTTIISPGSVDTELVNCISNQEIKRGIEEQIREFGLPAEAIANSILYAISQSGNIAVNEIIVRPTKQEI